jgi:hypothetical protein
VVVRIWTTAEMKETAGGLSDAGYTVRHKLNGWIVTMYQDGRHHEVLKSMHMGNGRFLVRYDKQLFQGEELNVTNV